MHTLTQHGANSLLLTHCTNQTCHMSCLAQIGLESGFQDNKTNY